MKKRMDIQQRSPEWEQLRKTRLTGTMVKSIMGTPRAKQEAFYEVIANRLTIGVESDGEYENPMDRGTRLEPDAIASFELETGKSIENIGLCESDENEQIAMSPDGYVRGTNYTEAIEVKCMGGKNHVKLWFENVTPDEHGWQVVQYFVVDDDLKKLYFVGYNPDIPIHPLHIIEVNREDILSKIEKSRSEQKAFLEMVNEKLKEIIKL